MDRQHKILPRNKAHKYLYSLSVDVIGVNLHRASAKQDRK